MTKYVDEVISKHLSEIDTSAVETVCGNCYQTIEVDIDAKEAYCPYCEADVFVAIKEKKYERVHGRRA